MPLFISAKKNLASVKNYQPGKPIEEVEREYGIHNAIKMASNENPLGPSPKAVAAIKKVLNKIHRYPDGGSFYLREKISKKLKVEPENLLFGNGSDEILVMAVRAFVSEGDEILISDPTFLIYEIAATVENGTIIKVPMKNFCYDLEGFAKKISSKTKIIFIANPDNPVGTYVTQKNLENFLKIVPSHVVVVLDEAYYEFGAAKKDYPNALPFLKKYSNLIIARTFSKAYGLAGLRIGYGVMSPDLVETLNKVREPFNVNLLAQAAAIAALDDAVFLKKSVSVVSEGRRYLEIEFAKMKLAVVPTVTNFMLVDLETDANAVYEKLLRKGIIVRSMRAWGLQTFIRVTIGKKEENKRFIQTLKEILK